MCSHGHRTCHECLAKYLTSCIQDRPWSVRDLRCPVPACSFAFRKAAVLSLVDDAVGRQYKHLLKHPEHNPSQPATDPSFLQYVAQRGRGIQRCPRCGAYCELMYGCNRVTCRCGCRFCMNCGRVRGEFECSCSLLPEWLEIGLIVVFLLVVIGLIAFVSRLIYLRLRS